MAAASNMKLYLFGDQTFDVQPQLKALLRQRNNPVLEEFLAKAYEALRGEIYELPYEARQSVPRLTSLDDLASWNEGEKRSIALDMAVTCIFQLATFIVQAKNGRVGGDEARVVGICTGALAAAAVSCSDNLLELVPLGVAAVKAAFRVGKQVADAGQRIAPRADSKDQSWSMLVAGASSEAAVRDFCEQSSLPITSQPYVTAYSPSGIAVGGPPQTLAQLAGSPGFQGVRSRAVPVYGPYHAPHLYSQLDVAAIVDGLAPAGDAHERVPLLASTSAATPARPRAFDALLEAAVAQILLQPIRWAAVLDSLQQSLREAQPASFAVVPLATTADQLVYEALQQTPLRSLVPSSLPPRPQQQQTRSSGNASKSKLAIIGMSGRFPSASGNDAFWELLHQGLDVHKTVPAKHWDVRTHVDPTGKAKNTSRTPFGCWIDEPGHFDARFFNISPREAPQIDPSQRLALMTAYEALEQAGIVPDATPSTRRDRVGVFYGVTSDDWRETNAAQNIDTYLIPGGNRAFIPGRINYYFKFSGPSYVVDTACSSSLAGIHLACNSLWNGDVDMAIAGGTNVLTNPDLFAGLDRGHFLSRTGNCKTFDDGADGYCRGEGAATVLLKRLDDALADGDPILATVLSTSTNHSAESESITRPSEGAQRAIFKKILNQGGIDPYSVGYIEMHGTGTQAGDASEMSSVLGTFAPAGAPRPRGPDEALYLGSVKANIGHGESASGVCSLVKVLLMLKKDTIVPHCGIKTRINQKFPTDLAARNVNIAMEPTRWARTSAPRRALINNFSAAGGNTALLLEDAPARPETPAGPADPRGPHLVACSAKSVVSLQGNLRALQALLRASPDMALGQLSYTTTARRIHYKHRVMLAATSINDVCAQIDAALRDSAGTTAVKTVPRLLFTYTGQGAQYPGMGRQLFEHLSFFRREISLLDQMAQNLGFPAFLPFITAPDGQDMAAFSPTTIQLAAVCMQIALTKLWSSWNVTPAAVVGHSLGEYAALNAAGVLSDADAVYLVGRRAQLLEAKCTRDTHAMLVVRGSTDEIARALDGRFSYETACINSPVETVLAGTSGQVADLAAALGEAGFKTTMLCVPYAFHSSQVEPIMDDFKSAASGVTYSTARVPVLCPLDGSVIAEGSAGDFGADYLARHLRQPVNMQQALLTARSSGLVTDHTSALELGPHPAVGGMVRAVLGQKVTTLATLQRGRPAWETLAATLKALYTAGAEIRWPGYHRDFTASHVVLPLNAYSWDLKDYWIQYVNDWTLRKGDPPLILPGSSSSPVDGLTSTTIHRIVEESGSATSGQMVVEADIAREDLSPLVQGHEVDGVPLCTPSVYADMALSLGRHLAQTYSLGQAAGVIDVCDLTICKALILSAGTTKQLLQAHVSWAAGKADIKFMSFDNKQRLQEHARCAVRFPDGGLQKQLQAKLATTKQNMKTLRDGLASGKTARFNRPMFYRALRPLARFHEDYRAVDEVLLDSDTLQASSRLSFNTVKKDGHFHTHPAIIDALTQASGFSVNCNDNNDLDVEVFINHGWGSFQTFKPIDFNKVYTTYTHMKEGADKLWKGDIVVCDGDEVVAAFGQLAMQGVPRKVLRVILSIESGEKTRKQQPQQVEKPRKQQQQKPAAPPASNPRQAAAEPTGVNPSSLAKALQIISEESGLGLEELGDGVAWGDVGIDSLLGLSISARFKNELDIDLDFNAFFYEYPLIGDLKTFFNGQTATSTPPSSDSEASRSVSRTSSVTDVTMLESPFPEVDFKRALTIISEESGLELEDLTDDTNFADSGVDSLLSLVIVSRFRSELGLDIQHESLFLECSTVADIKKLLAPDSEVKQEKKPAIAEAAIDQSFSDVDFKRALAIISEESGLGLEDLTDDTNFADSGVDSLLSLVIVSRFRSELDLDIQHESLFLECSTVADIKKLLAPDSNVEEEQPAIAEATKEQSQQTVKADHEKDTAARAARKAAVDELVAKHVADFSGPTSSPQRADSGKVVLVTGASGNLGCYLVTHIAQLADVEAVVCLNRKNRSEANERQDKAMTTRGIRLPEALKHKLQVYQTDSAKPRLGLSESDYEHLAGSVTHLVHNAWPMSVKRPLAGFESQFQVMRNLIDLARDAASRRPESFKFSFQLVSSISVVGHYGTAGHSGSISDRITVPEQRMNIDAVLPTGYSDAKWGCERMLDETLHQYPNRFRPMVVRLGQIAGSRASGYWNTAEHFPFLIKSSQTLQALPNVDGTVFWTPVDDVAGTLSDLVVSDRKPHDFYHIDNPVGQEWRGTSAILADALNIPKSNLIPFHEWVERVRRAPAHNNPASALVDFLDSNYLRMSCGGLVLGVENALEHSKTLSSTGPVSEEVIRSYIHSWKSLGFLTS
ncbi:starter unit:ACP transacylase in aflatoxin biosynthesis domain-containing protein [Hirsutella rhossiliensis]|uniref:Starter unit:ACP transacylase in aflatoxin biosynthesis domain-containing protein n=1 Tax=Hirsutella rhossiliensis TaxID=111463 RepID=A0A9P8N5H2_9HYPO|nr:starter unit:ACP transacylase in aflatoxin biosynthesis domain-containing protein [Hirsutella rhossiliensis]KAH0966119.1 starter unit:ACP transacylase in aflatoxin biosynthesis domain-containing protein [Hirsutella rhossiliensis]